MNTNYFKNRYGLQVLDFVKLNKEKLAEIFNNSEIDALTYIQPFCLGDKRGLCDKLIEINKRTVLGSGSEECTTEELKFYRDGEWELLGFFGIKNAYGEAEVE
jgi:hypothetical protein